MYEYEAVGLPRTTLEVETTPDTGQKIYTATVYLEGLKPIRSLNSDERRNGLLSLDPPQVWAYERRDLKNRAIRAVASSFEATAGTEYTVLVQANISTRVGLAVAGALRKAGEE
jgi:hypothetical protein